MYVPKYVMVYSPRVDRCGCFVIASSYLLLARLVAFSEVQDGGPHWIDTENK